MTIYIHINSLAISNIPRGTSMVVISKTLRPRPHPDTDSLATRNALCEQLDLCTDQIHITVMSGTESICRGETSVT